MRNVYVIANPTLLHGTRCYVDASTEPDQLNSTPSPAGLDVFILTFQEHMTRAIYIKVKLQNCSSVIMAEATRLALASAISYNLNLSGVNFLSDCEQLVRFLNKNDISDPPNWRIKYFTQSIANYT